MKFSLIVCTYQRLTAIKALLHSVDKQTIYPDEILIIDGSKDDETQVFFYDHTFTNLEYFKVDSSHRGLTKQRNYGVAKTMDNAEVIFFLDDDIILDPQYFEEILKTYNLQPDALGVSGYITNESKWKKVSADYIPFKTEFRFENWVREEGARFRLRRKFGLAPNTPPGYMPDFSHGYSTGFLPPSGKTYEVEMLMGGISSYRKEVFTLFEFSPFFEGYGLYEDADFSLRISKHGRLLVNTSAKVEHYHAVEGRPNMFKYGKMVIVNGFYVWKVKNTYPSFNASVKWHSTAFLLTLIRVGNIFNTNQKKAAFTEAIGRLYGWWIILWKNYVLNLLNRK